MYKKFLLILRLFKTNCPAYYNLIPQAWRGHDDTAPIPQDITIEGHIGVTARLELVVVVVIDQYQISHFWAYAKAFIDFPLVNRRVYVGYQLRHILFIKKALDHQYC